MPDGIAGLDEAGRGPVIGPLVVGAVHVDDPDEIDDLPIADSKQLRPGKRRELAATLRKRVDVATVVASATEVDAAAGDGNLNTLELDLFADAATELRARRVVADACDPDADRFARRLHDRLDGVDVHAEHGADAGHPIVGAASIVAKVERDARIQAIADDLDAEIGSGYPGDQRTVAFLEDWIRTRGRLPPHTRRTWKTARRLIAEHKQHSLSEY